MIPSYSIEMRGDAQALIARFGNRAGLGQAIARAIDMENELTLNVVRRKLSGDVLNRVTGRLRDSMQRTDALVIAAGESLEVRSSIGSNVRTGGASVVYAAIHEYGGQTRPHKITAKNKSALSFFIGGKAVVVKSVNHPGSKIPARPYLRPSVEESLPRLRERVGNNIVKFYGGAN